MDFSTRLRGINPTNTVFYSPQPRAEVYCLLMNFKISKLVYYDFNTWNVLELRLKRMYMILAVKYEKKFRELVSGNQTDNL